MNRQQVRLIRGGQLWTPDGFLPDHTLLIESNKIMDVRLDDDAFSLPTDGVVDAKDGLIIPGLIDLQVNGGLGWSFQASHRQHFGEILQFHLAAGTTTLLPTIITADPETLLTSLQTLAEFLKSSPSVTLPGIHLEGPFLNPEKSGAHDPQALRLPDLPLMQRFNEAAGGYLKLVTLAPELSGSIPIIEYLVRQGIIVSAGHSAATYADMQKAVQAGLSMVTHAGNASDWPHRAPGPLGFMASEPGVVGALLAEPALAGGVIMDGYHFHPALLAPLTRLKGCESIILVSDASTVAGCPPGEYESGGLQVIIHPQGFATSGRGGGWLAGSTIRLLDAVRRAVQLAHIPLVEAVTMATLGPAKLLGIAGSKGQLCAGKRADIVILNKDLSLRHVIAGGQSVV